MGTETPENGGFMVVAYLIVAVVVFGYGLVLWRRARKALRGD
jgi:hypothetical protein